MSPPNAPTVSRFSRLWEAAGMLLVLALLFAVCAIFIKPFLTVLNLRALAMAVSTIGMVACTMLFCLAAGDFDLSVGSVIAFAGVLSVTVMNATQNMLLGLAAGLGAGALVGFFNGVFVARLGINALITTLATMQIVRGLGFVVTGGNSAFVQHATFSSIGNYLWLGVPVPVWLTVACLAGFGALLNLTVFGRETLAVGGNREAAHLAGVSVTRVKIIIFTLQGMVAALAGIAVAAKLGIGDPKAAQGAELSIISACVLGGVSLTGGVGRMSHVIAGVFIMGIVENAMSLLNINSFYQYIVRGTILLAAVMLDRLKRRG
jgi:L-arabinose transport system permease protein